MSGAVGSKPTFTVSGFPRRIFAFRSFFSIRSTDPLARYSSCSSRVMGGDSSCTATRRHSCTAVKLCSCGAVHPLLKHQHPPQQRFAAHDGTVIPDMAHGGGIEPSLAGDALRVDEG